MKAIKVGIKPEKYVLQYGFTTYAYNADNRHSDVNTVVSRDKKYIKLRNRFLFIGLLLTFTVEGYSQDTDSTANSLIKRGEKNLSLLIGYNVWDRHYLEVGIAKNRLDIVGRHPLGISYFASTEVRVGKETVVGPKVGIWGGSGFALGLNAMYYTDFSKGTLRLRPEIGSGLDFFKIVYGYNLALTNKDFDYINDHNISIAFLLRLKKKE